MYGCYSVIGWIHFYFEKTYISYIMLNLFLLGPIPTDKLWYKITLFESTDNHMKDLATGVN